MGVKHRLIITEGWKAKERNRYGKVVVIEFYEEETGKKLFTFAPKLLDIPEFEQYFKIISEYDLKMRIRRMLENEEKSKTYTLHDEGFWKRKARPRLSGLVFRPDYRVLA